jgi:hypothetical protein
MRFGHVGTHHQLGLRPILQEHSGRCGQASASVDVRTKGAAAKSGGRSFDCTGTYPSQFGYFEMINPMNIAIYAFGGFMLFALAIGFFAAPV